MKKLNLLFGVVLMLALAGLFITPARAQEVQPAEIVWINSPISAELRQALDTWLLNSPPSPAVYYAVTYTQPVDLDMYVSMVGLNIENPTDFWSLVGDEYGNQQVIWLDTVRVLADGTVTFPFAQPIAAVYKLAAPVLLPLPGAGGGAYVRFPWQAGKAVQYGMLGVHDAEFGTSGTWGAVDLVSGTDMGSGAANDKVYASVAGEVTYICNAGNTRAVRLVGGGDSFLYAHLLPNDNLVLNHNFSAGALMGSLKHGSFTDECGNAVQQNDHYHLHWGFIKSDGRFQAEGCFITGAGPYGEMDMWKYKSQCAGVSLSLWKCRHQPRYRTVGIHLGEGAGGGPSFWDYLLPGIKDIFDAILFDNLPEHSSSLSRFITPIINGVKIVFRISSVLIKGNLNLAPALGVVVFAITLKLSITVITYAGYIYRLIRG